MRTLRTAVAVTALFVFAAWLSAAELPLEPAQGTVAKVEKDALTIKTRTPDGKFGKNLELKVTGTSKVTLLTSRTQGGKLVVVQKETEAKSLEQGQPILVIYTTTKDGSVLLS